MKEVDVKLLAEKCVKSKEYDYDKIKSLSDVDFAVMVWNLKTGRFDITGLYNDKGFFQTFGTYIAPGMQTAILNNINTIRLIFNKYLIK